MNADAVTWLELQGVEDPLRGVHGVRGGGLTLHHLHDTTGQSGE